MFTGEFIVYFGDDCLVRDRKMKAFGKLAAVALFACSASVASASTLQSMDDTVSFGGVVGGSTYDLAAKVDVTLKSDPSLDDPSSGLTTWDLEFVVHNLTSSPDGNTRISVWGFNSIPTVEDNGSSLDSDNDPDDAWRLQTVESPTSGGKPARRAYAMPWGTSMMATIRPAIPSLERACRS